MNHLSIIIPVYNTEAYLEKCLDSVGAIRYPLEVIIIDDGSTDASFEICERYAKKDNRFRVIHQSNHGLVEARKRGIAEVTGTFFGFVDSDDFVDAQVYDEMLSDVFAEQQNDADIICTGMTQEYRKQISIVKNDFPDGIYTASDLEKVIMEMLSKGSFFHFGILPNVVCKIFNTEFVRRAVYHISPDVSIGEDADMTFQLMLQAQRIRITGKAPYYYCRREGSMMWKRASKEAVANLENDLKSAFGRSVYDHAGLMEQLRDYMDFIALLCDPEKVLGGDPFFASSSDRIALYGAGGVGRAVRYGMKNHITLWVDKNVQNCHNEEVVSIEHLITQKDDYDKVFIAISDVGTCEAIKKSLMDMGVEKPIHYFRST